MLDRARGACALFYIAMIPNALATELARMIAANTGQSQRIIKLKTFFRRKLPPSRVTSCSMLLNAYHAGHQQAGGDGRDGHHHRVGQEVEEIEELHAQIPSPRPAGRSPGWTACPAPTMITPTSTVALRAAPAQLILEGGDRAFGQRDGAGDRCKQHQHKEQHAHCRAQAHAGKNFGDA